MNPRGYLSWTQVQVFEQDPKKYIQKYFYEKEDDYENDFMVFGKKFADALETGEPTGDEIMDFVISSMTKYKFREAEKKAPFCSKQGEFVLLGKMDTFEDFPHLRFREYKTGGQKWTQSRANLHGQLMHYATLIWLVYKKLPNEIWLDWIPTTREADGEVRFTGDEPQSFKVKIQLADVLTYLARVTKVAVAIDELYRKELGI